MNLNDKLLEEIALERAWDGYKGLFCSDGSLTVPFTFATILCLSSCCMIRSTEYNEQSYTILSSPIISFMYNPISSPPVLSNITSSSLLT